MINTSKEGQPQLEQVHLSTGGGLDLISSEEFSSSKTHPIKRRKVSVQRTECIGRAAEYIVCADLWLHGYRAFLSSPTSPFDVVVESDFGLCRIQVKSTERPNFKNGCLQYIFSTNRNSTFDYADTDVDMFAFVDISNRHIAYVAFDPEAKKHRQFALYDSTHRPSMKKTIPDIRSFSFQDAIKQAVEYSNSTRSKSA